MIKPVIKDIMSPDVFDFSTYSPAEDNFAFLLELSIGSEGSRGADLFGVVVCTPKWLLDKRYQDEFVVGRHYLICFKYDYEAIIRKVHEIVAGIEGETWNEVALKLGRYANWEFEDYKPYTGPGRSTTPSV